ncbi:MAG: patatin-like phospholipase family protein [Lacibacter sp.]
MKKKAHLVLGSGGARGIAHIGVIEQLEENDYEIISITGCSMGAVVGGMYCAGYLKTYKDWLLTLNKSKVFNLFDFTFTMQGFVKGEKVLAQLESFTGKQNIEELRIKFIAVATDIINRKEVHFTSGNLYKALRASIGIPGVFTPVQEDETFLVDGGVLNPLPLDLVNKKEDEYIIAVNINGYSETKQKEPVSSPEAKPVTRDWLQSFTLPGRKKSTVSKNVSMSVFDLVNTSYDFTQDRLTEMMIKTYPPDLYIEIPRNSCAVYEFYRAGEMIEIGKKAFLDSYNKLNS